MNLTAAIRSLARRPGLAATILVTLALGIGANSAIFSAVDAVLLKPLPYPDSDRLVSVYELNLGQRNATQLVAPGRLEEWNAQSQSFDGLSGSYFENLPDTTGELPDRVAAMNTMPRFFTVLGVAPALGRVPTPDEERFGGRRVIVLSDDLWSRRFNRDPGVIGRALVLGGASTTIIGVMPPSFHFPWATTEAWRPAQTPPGLLAAREARFTTAVGRLKRGVTIQQATTDLDAVQAHLGEQFPRTDRGWGASIVPVKEEQVGGVRRSLWFLLGAVTLVLLAACGNVACLLLADAARREHEFAVRFALGADRRRVVGQLMTEGAILAACGAAIAIVIARWGIDALRTMASQLPRAGEVRLDLRLVAFTLALSAATTMLFALVPALHASRSDPADALSRGGRSQSGGRLLLQRWLVAAQIALASMLLVGAGLLIRSFVNIRQQSPGFDASNVATFRMSAQWSERTDTVVQRQARTIARLRSIPGVADASFSQFLPAGFSIPPNEFHIVGRDPAEKTFSLSRSVGPGYFRTLHIPVLQGANCVDDPTIAPYSRALVTRAFADQFFPDGDAIGHRFVSPSPQITAEIVGVVGDVHENGLLKPADPLIYWCTYNGYWPDPFFFVRFDEARPASMSAVRAAMREIEPQRAVYAVRPLTDFLAESISEERLTTTLLAVFAATALLLASMGLYGVLSQLVASRRREIGVRMALGASAAQVLGGVVGQAAEVTGAGIAAGLAGSLVLARVMATLVFGVTPRDPLTFAAAPVLLAAVAMAAALVPARRAATIDPMKALRDD